MKRQNNQRHLMGKLFFFKSILGSSYSNQSTLIVFILNRVWIQACRGCIQDEWNFWARSQVFLVSVHDAPDQSRAISCHLLPKSQTLIALPLKLNFLSYSKVQRTHTHTHKKETTEIKVFWNVVRCNLMDNYQCFRGPAASISSVYVMLSPALHLKWRYIPRDT